ncbi:7948_t:CDS:1, partial [Racocetra persica]
TTAFHDTVSSSRLPHISARRLIEKAERYIHIDAPCKTLMGDVCDFTPGQNGFSVEKNAEEISL